jgi:hypothetical protein
VKRLLVYKPGAQRELSRMDRSDAERIIHSLEVLAAASHGDVKARLTDVHRFPCVRHTDGATFGQMRQLVFAS